MEYYESTGPAVAKLLWSSLSTPKQAFQAASFTFSSSMHAEPQPPTDKSPKGVEVTRIPRD